MGLNIAGRLISFSAGRERRAECGRRRIETWTSDRRAAPFCGAIYPRVGGCPGSGDTAAGRTFRKGGLRSEERARALYLHCAFRAGALDGAQAGTLIDCYSSPVRCHHLPAGSAPASQPLRPASRCTYPLLVKTQAARGLPLFLPRTPVRVLHARQPHQPPPAAPPPASATGEGSPPPARGWTYIPIAIARSSRSATTNINRVAGERTHHHPISHSPRPPTSADAQSARGELPALSSKPPSPSDADPGS